MDIIKKSFTNDVQKYYLIIFSDSSQQVTIKFYFYYVYSSLLNLVIKILKI